MAAALLAAGWPEALLDLGAFEEALAAWAAASAEVARLEAAANPTHQQAVALYQPLTQPASAPGWSQSRCGRGWPNWFKAWPSRA